MADEPAHDCDFGGGKDLSVFFSCRREKGAELGLACFGVEPPLADPSEAAECWKLCCAVLCCAVGVCVGVCFGNC